LLYEKDEVIGQWSISDPPRVSVECVEERDADAIRVTWETEVPEGSARELRFLVQWQDDRGTWRGCAPRTQERELLVPRRLFAGKRHFAIRVLASAGIATGVGVCEGDLGPPEASPAARARAAIALAGVPRTGKEAVELPSLIRVVARSPLAGMMSKPEIRWYDERGGEIGRGRSFDLRRLPEGRTLLSAAVLERGQGSGTHRWLIERTPSGRFFLVRETRDGNRPKPYERAKE
jgi:hypothetical protein